MIMVMKDNLAAFLTMIRYGEGTSGENGYRVMFGGELINSFEDHPRKKVRRKMGGQYITSTAAGAYQFLSRTWDECRDMLELPDFTPHSQDRAATFLIYRRGALGDVIAGRFYSAVRKCNREWASLPESPYGQPVVTWDKALELYENAGGYNIEERYND